MFGRVLAVLACGVLCFGGGVLGCWADSGVSSVGVVEGVDGVDGDAGVDPVLGAALGEAVSLGRDVVVEGLSGVDRKVVAHGDGSVSVEVYAGPQFTSSGGGC